MPMKIIKNRIEEIREHVNSGMREAALKLIYGLFPQELGELCGAMLIDAVHIGNFSVVVALGIDKEGKKHILGLKQGATEDWEIVRDLFRNLVDRGFKTHHALLFVIDGPKALRKGISKYFGKDQAIRLCTLHKQRNIMKYLDKKHHLEFKRRWKKLHGHKDFQESKKDYKTLVRWLGELNFEAQKSLEEANMESLTVIG